MLIGNGLHEYNLSTGVLCDLFDLKLTEVGGLDLYLSARYGNNTVLGRLNALANFLALAHVYLHGFTSLLQADLRRVFPERSRLQL